MSESCNPDWVSLPLAGWGHTRALYDLVDLHLVTKPYNREALLKQDIPPERIDVRLDGGHPARRGPAP